MAAEEEQSQLYNVLISPAEDEGQVTFSCHLRRGGPDSKQDLYELVQFVGYFSKTYFCQMYNFLNMMTSDGVSM